MKCLMFLGMTVLWAMASSGEEAEAKDKASGLFPADVKTVGIVSASSILPKEKFILGTNRIASAGYRVKVMPNVQAPQVAPAATRARLFEQAWLDPEIDIILFSRGGKGAADVIGLIDWEKLRSRDMRVIGFSDVTLVVNTMLAKKVGHPYTGPMLSSFGSWTDKSRDWFGKMLAGAPLPTLKVKVLKAGAAKGLPMGGHVDRLYSLFKQAVAPETANRIVFLECTNRYSANDIKVKLVEMRDSGFLKNAAAVVFADFRHTGKERVKLDQFMLTFAGTLPCPVFADYPYGHCPGSLLIDFQREAEIAPDGTFAWLPTTPKKITD